MHCWIDILSEAGRYSGKMSTQKDKGKLELLQGTLDLLILRTLIFGPQHGQGIARAIQETSDEELLVEHGALYPALQRLEERGWISLAPICPGGSAQVVSGRGMIEGRTVICRFVLIYVQFVGYEATE